MMDNVTMELTNEVNLLESEIWGIAHRVWELSELSLEERESSALEAQYLAQKGFTLSDHGIGGLDYAWIATWGSSGPVIGIAAEFDALPGLGNEIVSVKMPRKDGNPNGHGCGHNLIGVGAIGAAVALKNYLEKHQINATIKVFGCPAEELITGKNYMAKAGAFEGLDACLHWHPFNKTSTFNVKTPAVASIRVEFFGKTSHSGVAPWLGRSAAHASEIFTHGINVMREHMLPDSRVHYLVEKSGIASNVISDYSRIMLGYRGVDAENVRDQAAWIRDIARGAALATQTRTHITDLAGCYDILPNQTIADRIMFHLNELGAPKWSAEEQEFAKQIQKSEGYELSGLSDVITPDPKGMPVGGASDVGDISYITPTSGILVACWPIGFAPHTWGATVCNGMSIGKKGMMLASTVLALTGLDLITDNALLTTVKNEFNERTGGKPYKSLCELDTPPLAADHVHHVDTHDAIKHL